MIKAERYLRQELVLGKENVNYECRVCERDEREGESYSPVIRVEERYI